MSDVAVVLVALTRAVCTGRMEPPVTPVKTTVVPDRSTIEMLPAAPAYIARHTPSGKSVLSFGVIARHAPLVCVDVCIPLMILSDDVSSLQRLIEWTRF